MSTISSFTHSPAQELPIVYVLRNLLLLEVYFFLNLRGLLFTLSGLLTVKAFVVISPEEGSNAEVIPRKVMASRLMINSAVVQVVLKMSLFDTQQCYRASSQNRVEGKEMLIKKGWSCG